MSLTSILRERRPAPLYDALMRATFEPNDIVCITHPKLQDPWGASSFRDITETDRSVTASEKAAWAAVTGTAFDYLARGRTAARTGYVEGAARALKAAMMSGSLKTIAAIGNGDRIPPLLVLRMEELLERSVAIYTDLCSAKATSQEDLYPSLYMMSRMESIYRSSSPRSVFNFTFAVETSDTYDALRKGTAKGPFVKDLNIMIEEFEKTVLNATLGRGWKARKNPAVVFNPSFGNVSAAVGGADADIVIGNTLYDLKTGRGFGGGGRRRFGYDKVEAAQVSGYLWLHRIAKDIGDRTSDTFNTDIDSVALYHARIGRTVVWKNPKEIEKKYQAVRAAIAECMIRSSKIFSSSNFMSTPQFLTDTELHLSRDVF